jgi:hypothetical protein
MTTKNTLVKTMLMSILTAGTIFAFTACSDDLEIETAPEFTDITRATPVEYNINDEDFNADHWRDVPAIYINDGSVNLTTANMRDPNNYKIVTLPWYKGGADLSTNLPADFCDNITPENGWYLVVNRCGNLGLANNNYFAVYNKWTGILRFFYYQPAMTYTGNDHIWQVTMTDELAQHSLWGYGLPSTATIKNKSMFCNDNGNTMSDYMTPYAATMDNNGCIVPHEGWWAFDVDLSLYRPEPLDGDNSIKLQMRSWTTQHVSLWSTMTASIDGEFKQQVKKSGTSSATIAKGVMLGAQAAALGASAVAGFKASSKTNGMGTVSALNSIAGIFGCGGSIAGLFEKGPKPMEATISLGMDGTIDTQGTINASAITTGITSPTIFLSSFNRNNAPGFAQGVWNIKKHPLVYICKDVCFRLDYEKKTEKECTNYFLDPSSIEVELNPDVFPEDEVEWMQVDAHCIATKKMGMTGTDRHREAYGLGSRIQGEVDFLTLYPKCTYDQFTEFMGRCFFDYMHFSDDKGGLDWPAKVYEDDDYSIVGRGTNDLFAIEPALLMKNPKHVWPNKIMVPGIEVNVLVQVKMKDREEPILLSRNYLPEITAFKTSDFSNGKFDYIKTHELSPKQEGHRDSYDYQVDRVFKILKTLESMYNYTYTPTF